MPRHKSKSNTPPGFLSMLAAVRGRLIAGLLLGAMAAGAAFGYLRLRHHVHTRLAYPRQQPVVVLKDRPAWMSDALAQRIASAARPAGMRSALDHQLLKDTADVLQHNPWVRHVRQVRRIFGSSPGDTIEIDCEYREPMALVACRDQYILIDGQGCRLPERFPATGFPRIMFDPQGGLNLRIIEGVAALPPYRDGQQWTGEDIQAGLDLAKLLYGKPFANEICKINVANFNGRKNPRLPHLSLFTTQGSEIAWGRPVRSVNFELPPSRKLELLAANYRHFGRVDAGKSWIDIRNDIPLQLASDRDSVVHVQSQHSPDARTN